MLPPRLRSPRRAPASVHRAAAALLLVAAISCGGGSDGGGGTTVIDMGTGPAEFPKVQGYFTRNENVAALTCTPSAPTGGDIAPGSYPLSEPVAFTQSGSKVSIVLINYPSDPPDTGTVDMSGKVTLGFKLPTLKEKALREGRQFYVDITGSFVLTRSADGTKLMGTGSYENVLHEGSATAPVYSTCTRSSTIEMTRTGG